MQWLLEKAVGIYNWVFVREFGSVSIVLLVFYSPCIDFKVSITRWLPQLRGCWGVWVLFCLLLVCPTTHGLISKCAGCRYLQLHVGGYLQLGGCWGVGECEYCSTYCLCVLQPTYWIARYMYASLRIRKTCLVRHTWTGNACPLRVRTGTAHLHITFGCGLYTERS